MKKIMLISLCFVIMFCCDINYDKFGCDASNWCEIASFSTSYSHSAYERKENIKVSARKLNGMIVDSGETFSFNNAVGRRTLSNGYKLSTVIQNGVYTGGVGGGVCQTSTTLYNSALRAGLKITEVHQHSLLPSYVEPSFDAMVSGEGSDLKFKNIYSYPIKIVATANNSDITVKIYAPKKIEGLEILPYSTVVRDINPPKAIEKLDSEFENVSVAVGELLHYRNSKQGKISKGYVIYKYNGTIVRVKQIRSDKYIPVQGINIIGTKIEEKPKEELT